MGKHHPDYRRRYNKRRRQKKRQLKNSQTHSVSQNSIHSETLKSDCDVSTHEDSAAGKSDSHNTNLSESSSQDIFPDSDTVNCNTTTENDTQVSSSNGSSSRKLHIIEACNTDPLYLKFVAYNMHKRQLCRIRNLKI